ncbi:MAG: GDSL-type esterase/lipase family protein [Candidatus Hydrogenedentota bacterium]
MRYALTTILFCVLVLGANADVIFLDLTVQSNRQVVVDREAGQYLGHPTTVLLEDNKTMLCVYPKGHGRGGIVYKRSYDGGLTWSERLPTPKSWSTSREVPTLHRVIDADETKRIIMFSGLYPTRMSVTKDDGLTWSELKPVGDWGGIVVMGFAEPIRTGPGHYMAMFHDDGRFFTDTNEKKNPVEFTLYKTFSEDGGMTWSFPETIATTTDIHICEPGLIRSPNGKQLAVLLRENSRTQNSQIIFSNDEGKTWTDPRPMPDSLNGDRHTGKYGPDGRLFISFRSNSPKGKKAPTEGDWAAWVGTYDDLVSGDPGQYHIRLKDNTKGKDCAYPGVEILPDGTFVTTTYGHWDEGEEPYILSVRLKLDELDAMAKRGDIMASQSQTIVAFGDSTTALRDTINEVYADRLPDLLKARGINATVINSAVGGSHTGRYNDNKLFRAEHARDRFESAVIAHDPDTVIIQFGWNDSWIDLNREGAASRISVKNYRRNLGYMIYTLQETDTNVILMTPNRPRSSVEDWRIERTELYVDVVRELALKYDVPLVDVWNEYEKMGADADALLLDRLHPNDEGHRIVAELLCKQIAATE